ncbi:MAG: hypothetical protein ABIQ88_05155 [Chitinophagaceae bacterium]
MRTPALANGQKLLQNPALLRARPVSLLLLKLQEAGLTPTDIHNIEYLDNKEVLKYLPGGFRWLKRNIRQDVVDYFEAFAYLLEEKMLQEIEIPSQVLLKLQPDFQLYEVAMA